MGTLGRLSRLLLKEQGCKGVALAQLGILRWSRLMSIEARGWKSRPWILFYIRRLYTTILLTTRPIDLIPLLTFLLTYLQGSSKLSM